MSLIYEIQFELHNNNTIKYKTILVTKISIQNIFITFRIIIFTNTLII